LPVRRGDGLAANFLRGKKRVSLGGLPAEKYLDRIPAGVHLDFFWERLVSSKGLVGFPYAVMASHFACRRFRLT